MDDILNGPKFIKRIIRPPRLAITVNTLAHVEKFISIASLSWGGRYFLAVPCSVDGIISNEWYDVLKKYNPDNIKTFCELPQTTIEKLWKSRFAINKITKHTQIKIDDVHEKRENVQWVPEFFGQPIINLMLLDGFYNKNNDKARLTYIPLQSDYDLYYKARFGIIDTNEWIRWQNIYIEPSSRKNKPDEVIENANLSIGQDILSYIHQNRTLERSEERRGLIEYTTSRLGHVYIERIFSEQQPKSETSHIVVVSKEENIEDFCWFWAIRGQRFNPFDPYSKGPLWIDQKMLTSNFSKLQDLFVNRKNIYILSKSMKQDDLPTLGEGWFFQMENLQEFYNEYYYIGDTVDIPVNFVDNETEYKYEVPESIQYLNVFYHHYAMLDIQIPGIVLPKVRDFHFGEVFFPNYWITKSGFTRKIFQNRDEIVKLVVPTAWDVISTYADAAEYSIENSDKGVIGNELVRLVGGEKNIWVISHPAVIDLLLEMSNVNKINKIKRLIRDNIEDDDVKYELISSLPRKSLGKKIMPFSSIKAKLRAEINDEGLDEKSSVSIIDWLLDKGLLLQGKKIPCRKCFTDNWIPVEKFDSKIMCQGCLNEIKKPFSTDKIDWEYEINTLVSAEIDQGLLVHLLTGFHILDEVNSQFQKGNIYGSYYGIKFVKDDNNKEIDVAFVIDGQLIIGECKVSGREFSLEIMQNILNFAREINSSKVIFSCFEHMEDLLILKNSIIDRNIDMVFLGKNELFNQYPGLAFDIQSKDDGKEKTPIKKSERYMQHIEILRSIDV